MALAVHIPVFAWYSFSLDQLVHNLSLARRADGVSDLGRHGEARRRTREDGRKGAKFGPEQAMARSSLCRVNTTCTSAYPI